MKKMFAAIAVMAILTTGLLSSCATKEHAINRLEKFSYELRDHSAYYTMDEWKQAAEKFVDIRKDIKKHEFEYTAEQKKKIGVLEGKCAGYMAKGAKEGFFDKLKGIGNEIKGILQGILNAVTDFVE